MQRFQFRHLALAIIFTLAAGLPAGAEESDELVTRLFDVSALTMGRPDFVGEQASSPRELFDEEQPLFGGEAEEPIYPAGGIDELGALIRVSVEPASWRSVYGADLSGIGEHTLRVRTFVDIADKVAHYLGALQRLQSRTVGVDLRAVRLTAVQVDQLLQKGSATLVDDARLASLVTAENAGPAASMLGYERHRFSMYAGSQRAYVWDYDVEVAEEAKISDPIVAVENLGLSASVRAILSSDRTSCLLTIQAFVAEPAALRQIANGEDGRIIEASVHDVTRAVARLDLPINRWALIDGQLAAGGGAPWMFLVRVRPSSLAGLAETARAVTLASPPSKPTRGMRGRSFDVASLGEAVTSTVGETINLTPSNFTPPEPLELEEASPVFPGDEIVELMKATVAPATWELQGASAEMMMNRLYMRNAAYVLDAVGQNLATLRKEFLGAAITRAQLVSVPEATATALGLDAGAVLTPQTLTALRAALAERKAERQGGARVTSMAGARNAASSGRRITYLSDFEVELAKGAVISNPVMQEVVSGTILDVRATRTAGAQSMQTILRFTHSNVQQPLRAVPTPHGDLEAPVMDLFRVRAAFRVPLDKTMVVATATKDGQRQVLLVSSRYAPSSR